MSSPTTPDPATTPDPPTASGRATSTGSSRAPDAVPGDGPDAPAPRRETVTGVPLHGRRPVRAHPPARSEISEHTSLGATYVRALMRSQLRAALTALAALAVLVGGLPLLFVLPAQSRGGAPAPLVWACLGLAVHPVLWLTARRYVRRAERNERDFTGLVEGPAGPPDRPRPPRPPFRTVPPGPRTGYGDRGRAPGGGAG